MRRSSIYICVLLLFLHSTAAAEGLTLATSASIKSSGLIDRLVAAFEKEFQYKLIVHPVGTGKALRMGREGKVDILFVHAPSEEKTFVMKGFGLLRTPIMRNSFVIVGPYDDPAKINGLNNAKQAFININKNKSLFISRADDSGTHIKELSIWQACNIEPYGEWYFEMGANISTALIEANKRNAYILVDKSTWLAMKNKLKLSLHVKSDIMLDNPYSVIAVNPKKHSNINFEGAKTFINWITSKKGQEVIASLKIDGEQLYNLIIE